MADAELVEIGVDEVVEFACRLEGGRGRVALRLDERKLVDQELGEVSYTLPPIGAGQHALRLTLFRESLKARGTTELRVGDDVRFRLEHDPTTEGFLGEHTIYVHIR